MSENGNEVISVIIPSYNQGQFIDEALQSILTQNYEPIEVLVMDGASTDQTLDILQNYRDRITVVSEPDSSATEAMNKGLRRAKGEYIFFLASDEVLCPGALSTLQKRMVEVNAGIVVGQGYITDKDSNVISTINNPDDISLEDLVTLKVKMPFACSFFRRSVFECYHFDESYVTCPDFPFWLHVFDELKIVFIQDRIAKWRHHERSGSVNPKEARNIFDVRIKAFDWFFKAKPQYRRLRSSAIVGAYCDLVLYDYYDSRSRAGLKLIFESLRRQPLATLEYKDRVMLRLGYHFIKTGLVRRWRNLLTGN